MRFAARLFASVTLLILLSSMTAWGQPPKPPAAPKAEPPAKGPANSAESEPAEDDSFNAIPERKDQPLPTLEELFKGPAVDWIVIKRSNHDGVLVVDPVDPRPGALEFWTQRVKDTYKTVSDKTPEDRERRLASKYVRLVLRAEPEQDYRLDIAHIREVVYFEDLMLQRVDLLLNEKKVRDALQLLLAIEARQRNWPGTVDRQKRLLFVEAEVLFATEPEQALARLEELFGRDPLYPQLDRQLGIVVELLVTGSLAKSDYRQARHYVRRLQRMFGQHLVVKSRIAQWLEQSQKLMADAVAAEQSGNYDVAVDQIEQAALVWPETPNLQVTHRRLCLRFQRLRVGVWDQPSRAGQIRPMDGIGSPSREADRRCQMLLEIPLFRPAHVERGSVRFAAPLLAAWEPTDLGHSLDLRLKSYRELWESRPTFTAGDVALALAHRLDPARPEFDDRLANYVESLSVESPTELTIRFRSVPLRPEALLSFPIQPAQAGSEQSTANSGEASSTTPQTSSLTWPFLERARDDRQVTFRRTVAEPDRPSDWHVAEVLEVRHDTPDKAVQALLRGDVHVVPRVPAWKVADLEKHGEFYVLPYDQPETHLLHFRPESSLLASRTLRRAMIYVLNRPKILDAAFLHGTSSRFGRLSSGPMSSSSYASNPQVKQYKYDPVLAVSLMPAVRKELGGNLPSITIRCSSDPQIQDAALQIVDAWNRLGLQATLVPEDSEKWDLCYRVLRMAEPMVELWPTVTYPHGTDVASLKTLAPWVREQLLGLDEAGDFGSAELLLHRIHRQLWAELPMIPLWELSQVMVVRKNIRGLPPRPFITYDTI